ncbi:hypothetical protein [Mycoplasma sp. CR]|uniref:hypothetical protein n=1 Tax=Mycoplasma sp. CR TaxID=3401693 RepID=UPI003AAC06C3
MKHKKWIIGAAIAIPVSTAIIVGATVGSLQNQKYFGEVIKVNFNPEEKLYSKLNDVDLDKKKSDIVTQQNESDINIYYSSWGVQPFYNYLRLAMLSNKEVHFIYTTDMNFQSKIDAKYFEDFLKNKRVVDQNNESEIRAKSDVTAINTKAYSQAQIKMEEVIKQNPNKQIAIWINSDHFVKASGIIALLNKYPNITIKAIEDSTTAGSFVLNTRLPWVKDQYFNKNTNEWARPSIWNNYSQYLLSTFKPRIELYFSLNNDVKTLRQAGLDNIYPFFNEEGKSIKDYIFNSRDKDKQRLMKHWSKISGLNWANVRDVVNAQKAKNNKPSLLVIGTSVEKYNKNYLTYIASKYSDKYNIFFKGHPGFNSIDEWIEDNFVKNHNEIEFTNLSTGKIEKYQLPKENIVIPIEGQIQVEELASDHALETDGLYFDKWTALDFETSAYTSIVNGINDLSDIIEIRYWDEKGYKASSNKDSNYLSLLESLASLKVTPHYVSIQLKETSVNKAKDQLQIDDFNITSLNPNKLQIAMPASIKMINKKEKGYEYVLEIPIQLITKSNNANIYKTIAKIAI